MTYGVPLFEDRVAPRCTISNSLMLVKTLGKRISSVKKLSIEESSWIDILKCLIDNRIETLVCGGIKLEDKRQAIARGISVIDNVACDKEELIEAIETKSLKSGLGISTKVEPKKDFRAPISEEKIDSIDCLSCPDKVCLEGDECDKFKSVIPIEEKREDRGILESAIDISFEEERKLCRLSEVIYFALEMNYERIGVAYCNELMEPTGILVSVLKRFFDVFPVCCKIGGRALDEAHYEDKRKISCNPIGQAKVLNQIGTDLNVLVGLCIGADCLFAKSSEAPATTLFVKDKSLANNPIGALYSDYYLKEATISNEK